MKSHATKKRNITEDHITEHQRNAPRWASPKGSGSRSNEPGACSAETQVRRQEKQILAVSAKTVFIIPAVDPIDDHTW
jgi:hypothetical protein